MELCICAGYFCRQTYLSINMLMFSYQSDHPFQGASIWLNHPIMLVHVNITTDLTPFIHSFYLFQFISYFLVDFQVLSIFMYFILSNDFKMNLICQCVALWITIVCEMFKEINLPCVKQGIIRKRILTIKISIIFPDLQNLLTWFLPSFWHLPRILCTLFPPLANVFILRQYFITFRVL